MKVIEECAAVAEREGASVAWVISTWQGAENYQPLNRPGKPAVYCTPLTELTGQNGRLRIPQAPGVTRHVVLQIPLIFFSVV